MKIQYASDSHLELPAQAREYEEGTIVDPEEHNDAVESCVCHFMEGARAAMFYNAEMHVRSLMYVKDISSLQSP